MSIVWLILVLVIVGDRKTTGWLHTYYNISKRLVELVVLLWYGQAINRVISCHPSDNGSLHINRTVASFSGLPLFFTFLRNFRIRILSFRLFIFYAD